MIVMYTSQGCSSCRKAKQYMKDNHLKFIEKDIERNELNEKEIRYLLSRSDNGSEDLISQRSKVIKEGNMDIDSMNINELVRFICDNPTVLKRPIIIDNHDMITGYDEDQISIFKKNNQRRLALAT